LPVSCPCSRSAAIFLIDYCCRTACLAMIDPRTQITWLQARACKCCACFGCQGRRRGGPELVGRRAPAEEAEQL
jgi:hypothetical protein